MNKNPADTQSGKRSSQIRFPSLLDLVVNRAVGFSLLGVGLILVLLNYLGLPSWRCPFNIVTHLDCPGCGMTRASGMLMRGELLKSWMLHPFAVIYAPLGVLLAILLFLPGKRRRSLIDALAEFDHRWGISALIVAGHLAYGLVRLAQQVFAGWAV